MSQVIWLAGATADLNTTKLVGSRAQPADSQLVGSMELIGSRLAWSDYLARASRPLNNGSPLGRRPPPLAIDIATAGRSCKPDDLAYLLSRWWSRFCRSSCWAGRHIPANSHRGELFLQVKALVSPSISSPLRICYLFGRHSICSSSGLRQPSS